ncbi:hypothetical protein [Halomicrobium katesii]|uniref:hypothetical protein n=1 Tax=Halomicrobium katesii TaxID=437163 RepID=UPI00037FBAD3|nr:hypothetical protein [Halomicrobium katesii]
MTQTYALTIGFQAHEYDDEFYLVGQGHGTPADVLEHVAGDHLLRIAGARSIEDYLLDVLKRGENTGEDEYTTTEVDVECGIHVDVPYRRFAFWTDDRVHEFEGEPTESEIESMVSMLRS